MPEIIENQSFASDTKSKLKFNLQSDGILIIRPQGALRRQDFEKLTAVVDPWIETHHRLVRRVALAVDGLLPEIISKLASHFVVAKIKQFPFDDEALALKWLKG